MKPLITTVLAVFTYCFVLGQAPMAVSLEQAQQYALEHAFAVKNARLDAAKAEREVKETLSLGLPQVTGSLDYNNYIDIPTQVAPADAFGFPDYLTQFLGGVSQETGVPLNAPATDPDAVSEFQFGADQTVTAGIQATQLLFDGSYFVGVQAQKAYAAAMTSSIRKSEVETKNAVASAYHSVLVAEENRRILGESRSVLDNSLKETSALLENGFAEEMDVDQLSLSLADLDSRIRYADQQVKIAKDMLKFQMGVDLQQDISLTDDIDALTADTQSGLLSQTFNVNMNPDVEVRQKYTDLAVLGVKNEKAKLLPRVAGFYTYQQNAQRDQFNFFDGSEKWFPIQLWGVQMSVPIFGSSLGYQRISKAKVDLARAEEALIQTKQGASLEYESARIEFENALDQRDIQQRNMDLAQRIFNKTQIKYNEGVSTSFELSQSQNQLLTAQGNYISSTLMLLNSRARLQKALNQ